MKRKLLLGILFFSGLWGASEAILGGYLYKYNALHPSVPLTIIAFIILTLAKTYLPKMGSATLIGLIAMLYKFLNTPFFACHLLAIFFIGLSYDLVFNYSKIKNRAVFAIAATYLGYILFALTITYVFRYQYWISEGLPKIIRYVGIAGTFAAIGNSVAVPLSLQVGEILKKREINPFRPRSLFATSSLSFVTLALWLIGITRCF